MISISDGPKSILVAGGNDDNSRLNSVVVLSTESSMKNKKIAELPKGIDGRPSLFLHDDNLLLCGGYGNENKCLMHENDSWTEHSTLNENRTVTSAVTTANGTFIFGGEYSPQTFEFLPRNSKVWQNGRTKIPDGFAAGCTVEVPNRGEILLIGGYISGTETRILKFEIKTQTFQEMKMSLTKEREGHICARLPDTNVIVITGGWYNGNTHDTTELLIVDDITILMPGNPMNTKRYTHGLAVITINGEDRLTVFGGNDDNDQSIDSVETLNPITREWEVSDLRLKATKFDFGYISLTNEFISKL